MVASIIGIEPNGGALPNPIEVRTSNYRQIRFEVFADVLCPPNQPMYADVYVYGGSIFYKTLTAYSIYATGGVSVFVFDIQDAMQEFLYDYIPTISGNLFVLPGFAINTDPSVLSASGQQSETIVVYFRGSTFSGGLLVPEPTAPTQGTATTAPVNTFSGLPCNAFNVVKSTIEPTFNKIYLNDLVNRVKANTITSVSILSDTEAYAMSNLPVNSDDVHVASTSNRAICPSCYNEPGGFPIMINRFGTSGVLDPSFRNCTYYVRWDDGITVHNMLLYATPQLIQAGLWYIPISLNELFQVQPTLRPIFNDARNSVIYQIVMVDVDSASVVIYTPSYKAKQTPYNADTQTIWFQNSYGHFEQVTFIRSDVSMDVKSSEELIPYTETGSEFVDGSVPNYLLLGAKKFNVRVEDTITMTGLFTPQLMNWLRDLFQSPYVFMRLPKGTTVSNANVDPGRQSLIQVKIVDATFAIRRNVKEGGTNYEVTIKVVPSINYIVPRN